MPRVYSGYSNTVSATTTAMPLVNESPTVTHEQGSDLATIWLHNTASITVALPCRRRWSLVSTGNVGQAQFTVPYDSPAADPAYVSEGSLVRIGDQSGSGMWNGIVTGVKYGEDGAVVTAWQPHIILNHFPVALNRQFQDVPAYVVVQEVFNQINAALASYPLLTGAVAADPTLLSTYQMHGESAWSVLQDMMAMTGNEIIITRTNDADQLHWGGDIGTTYPGILAAPGQFRDAEFSTDLTEQRAQVTLLSNYDWRSVSAGDVAANKRWPAHEVIKTSRPAWDRYAYAKRELDRLSQPAITITGSVPPAHWSIREGDHVRVLVPQARFTGTVALTRVMSREIGEDGNTMQLELQTIDEAVRTRPRQTGNHIHRDLRRVRRIENSGRRYLQEVTAR